MTRNLSRDVSVLLKIMQHQQSIIDVVRDFNCDFSQSNKSVSNNKYAFDLCALYMAQIGEAVKLLTDDSKTEVSKVIDIGILKYFRNMIDHAYEKVNKLYLQAYIQQMISKQTVDCIKKRYAYCLRNKRTTK